MSAGDRVTIGVITRRRPRELARLLDSLAALEIPPEARVEILVVENDDRPASDERSAAGPIAIRRALEPRAGIPFARNRVLDEAAPASDWIVFLDDDETVEPTLLAALLRTARTTGAPIVTGPSLPRFEPGAPDWAARSGAFEPRRHATGARLDFAFTNNVLFAARLVRGPGAPRLDESMRFTGGSDKEFFGRLAAAGHAIVWADDAVAYEWYPASRATRRWLLQRSFRLGTVALRTEGSGGLGARAALLWRAARFTARAAARFLAHLADPAAGSALAAWDIGRAAGLVVGALGIRYDEYASR